MEFETLLQIISRWLHVGTAIVLLGGSVFLRFIVLPAARSLPESELAGLRERIQSRWKLVVMTGIALLLATGFYNYIVRMGPSLDRQYHMWMGIKILLALGVFFLASALTGRSAGLASIRRDAGRWLTVLITLASLTVAIAGYLKVAFPAAE